MTFCMKKTIVIQYVIISKWLLISRVARRDDAVKEEKNYIKPTRNPLAKGNILIITEN